MTMSPDLRGVLIALVIVGSMFAGGLIFHYVHNTALRVRSLNVVSSKNKLRWNSPLTLFHRKNFRVARHAFGVGMLDRRPLIGLELEQIVKADMFGVPLLARFAAPVLPILPSQSGSRQVHCSSSACMRRKMSSASSGAR